MTHAERTEQMVAHVAAQEQSGTSRKAYCEQHALKLHVLNYWCAKHKRAAAAINGGFAEVQVSSSTALELHYPNGVRLLLPARTAMQHIAACIRLY
jgi:hypothetical protein